MRRLLDELHRLGAVDADRFARESPTQLIVERIVSQLVDLAAGINTHVSRSRRGRARPMSADRSAPSPLSASSTAGPR